MPASVIVGVASNPKARFELGDIVIGWFRWGVHRDSTIKKEKKTDRRLNGSRLYNKTITLPFLATYHPALPDLKNINMLQEIFKVPTLISYKKENL